MAEDDTVASLGEMRAAIRRNERAELAFLRVASVEWSKRCKFLALAYCRRTWCHHLILDFLAVRPGASFANQPLLGLGTGMIFGLGNLADALCMGRIWGEATASSAPFYEKVLRIRSVQRTRSSSGNKRCAVSVNATLPRSNDGLPKPSSRDTTADMNAQRKRDWLDECFEYEATHPIAFASPRALVEARLIAELDKARRPHRRNHRHGLVHRRKTVAG